MIKNRINEIDFLRFVAAMAVVFFHYAFRGYAADGMSIMPYPSLAPVSKYGFLGVQLFFMISGFVILMSASHGSIRNFTISRMVRLYPAFWACCTITFIVTLVIGAPTYSVSFNQYITNMTMLNEFIGIPSVDGAYWSLFVEMRFYALVAIILIIGKIHRSQELILSWLIISIV
ncbi:acyltransferase, partial [Salmonella enterica]|nr:acyltransferase [Salmonella enterica]